MTTTEWMVLALVGVVGGLAVQVYEERSRRKEPKKRLPARSLYFIAGAGVQFGAVAVARENGLIGFVIATLAILVFVGVICFVFSLTDRLL